MEILTIPQQQTEAWPTDEIRDVMLQLREEQRRNQAVLCSIIKRLSVFLGDTPRTRTVLPFESPFRKHQ